MDLAGNHAKFIAKMRICCFTFLLPLEASFILLRHESRSSVSVLEITQWRNVNVLHPSIG